MDWCEEYGGINFDLLDSIQTADHLCEQILQHAWDLNGVEYYSNWVKNRFCYSPAAAICTFATVCVTLSCIEDLPDPIRQLARDMRGLIFCDGNELYDSLASAAYRQDICLSADTYGLPPPPPDERMLIHQLQQENAQLIMDNQQLLKSNKEMETQLQQYNYYAPVYKGCTFNTNNSYGAPPSPPSSSVAANKPECSEAPQSGNPSSVTANRIKHLFLTPDGDEDFQRLEEERNRFLNYLSDHCLSKEILNSSQEHPILKAVVCFCAKWKALHFIDPKISAVAVVRFVTETCSVPFDGTSERAISNALARMLQKDYDNDTYYDVCDYF